MKFVGIIIVIMVAVMYYGLYAKEQQENIYKSFALNKKIKCQGTIIQKSKGWYIQKNTFFVRNKIFKTIMYCSVL